MAYSRPKRGRPTKADPKIKYVHVRVDADQYVSFNAQAESAGLSFSNWVRCKLGGGKISPAVWDMKLLILHSILTILTDLSSSTSENAEHRQRAIDWIIDEMERMDSLEALED